MLPLSYKCMATCDTPLAPAQVQRLLSELQAALTGDGVEVASISEDGLILRAPASSRQAWRRSGSALPPFRIYDRCSFQVDPSRACITMTVSLRRYILIMVAALAMGAVGCAWLPVLQWWQRVLILWAFLGAFMALHPLLESVYLRLTLRSAVRSAAIAERTGQA